MVFLLHLDQSPGHTHWHQSYFVIKLISWGDFWSKGRGRRKRPVCRWKTTHYPHIVHPELREASLPQSLRYLRTPFKWMGIPCLVCRVKSLARGHLQICMRVWFHLLFWKLVFSHTFHNGVGMESGQREGGRVHGLWTGLIWTMHRQASERPTCPQWRSQTTGARERWRWATNRKGN